MSNQPTRQQVLDLIKENPEIKDTMEKWYPDYFDLCYSDLEPFKVYEIIKSPNAYWLKDHVMILEHDKYALIVCNTYTNASSIMLYDYHEASLCRFKEVDVDSLG